MGSTEHSASSEHQAIAFWEFPNADAKFLEFFHSIASEKMSPNSKNKFSLLNRQHARILAEEFEEGNVSEVIFFKLCRILVDHRDLQWNMLASKAFFLAAHSKQLGYFDSDVQVLIDLLNITILTDVPVDIQEAIWSEIEILVATDESLQTLRADHLDKIISKELISTLIEQYRYSKNHTTETVKPTVAGRVYSLVTAQA